MAILKAVVLIGIGALIIRGALVEVAAWFRARHRLRRTIAVVVGHTEARGVAPPTRARSAAFRFTTEDQRVVEAVSSAYSYPGPKVGRQIRIVYDTADPRGSAERSGALVVKLVLAPFLVALGASLAGLGITYLW